MNPQAVGIRHEDEAERDSEKDPESEAAVVRNDSQIRQQKRDKKNGDDHGERQAIRNDHATDVITLLAEEGKAAPRALWKNFIWPAREQAPLLAVGAAQAKRVANDAAKGQGTCFVHLGQPDLNSITPSSDVEHPAEALVRLLHSHGHGRRRFLRAGRRGHGDGVGAGWCAGLRRAATASAARDEHS